MIRANTMPADNAFRFQTYSNARPRAPYERLRPELPPATESQAYADGLSRAGQVWRNAGVAAIYLVHGTFTGDDALGLIRELEILWPVAGAVLREQHKWLVDRILQDTCNYSPGLAAGLEQAMNSGTARQLPVRLFRWSSANHHLGRADGAVRLLDELLSRDTEDSGRLLLWGHSHAGNVFALLTNLLGGNNDARERFFHAGMTFYGRHLYRSADPVWQRVRDALRHGEFSGLAARLDLVTFGTPIRYGWETRGYRRLLHFVHHRPAPEYPEYLVPFPDRLQDVLLARFGDSIQQLGIAGTDFLPPLVDWHSWQAERRFSRLLQPGIRRRDLLARLRLGQRVPAEGVTLLVDYPADDQHLNQLFLGHAIYTRREWLAFHAQQIAQRLDGD